MTRAVAVQRTIPSGRLVVEVTVRQLAERTAYTPDNFISDWSEVSSIVGHIGAALRGDIEHPVMPTERPAFGAEVDLAELVTVCGYCSRAACWHGESSCERMNSSVLTCSRQESREALLALGAEPEENFSAARVRKFEALLAMMKRRIT